MMATLARPGGGADNRKVFPQAKGRPLAEETDVTRAPDVSISPIAVSRTVVAGVSCGPRLGQFGIVLFEVLRVLQSFNQTLGIWRPAGPTIQEVGGRLREPKTGKCETPLHRRYP